MIARVNRAEQKIFGATGYTLLEKNGVEAGQSVPHVHFHYFPRKVGDSNLWLAVRMFLAPWLKPLTNEELELQRDRFAD
jgi:diadenosine tetraphosphate (Ap4A) HIT family hydrolase